MNPPWTILAQPHPNIRYVTISHYRMKLFGKHFGETNWHVIRNGIDPVRFFYLDPKSVRLSEELDLFARDLVVVQPARITPRKNLELSIHIIRGLKLLGYNVLFILTGPYDFHEQKAVSYYRRLRYWINELELQDNIAVLAEYRFRDRTRLVPDRIFIRDLYLMADVLLMTSKDEGFGLPLLEAGMIKLPIACSGYWTVSRSRRRGMLFRTGRTAACYCRADYGISGADRHPHNVSQRDGQICLGRCLPEGRPSVLA